MDMHRIEMREHKTCGEEREDNTYNTRDKGSEHIRTLGEIRDERRDIYAH